MTDKQMKPCTDARELAATICVRFADIIDDFSYRDAAALIQSAFDKIRQECADRAEKYLSLCGWGSDGLTSAILSPEPAQDESKEVDDDAE